MSFKIGDRVRVKAEDSEFFGFDGVIKDKYDFNPYAEPMFDVQTAEGKGIYYDYELEECKID